MKGASGFKAQRLTADPKATGASAAIGQGSMRDRIIGGRKPSIDAAGDGTWMTRPSDVPDGSLRLRPVPRPIPEVRGGRGHSGATE